MRRLTVLAASVAVALVAVLASASLQAATQGRWVIRDLGTLGGPGSDANSINDRGQIVGWADTKRKDKEGEPISHAVLWENGKVRDLGTLGGPSSRAVSINSRGQIVGVSETKAKGELLGHIFLWENGKMRDLGIGDSDVVAINNRGQIIGTIWAGKPFPDPYAFLWQDGKVTKLGSLGLGLLEPVALNERGQVIGWYHAFDDETSEESLRAFLWQSGRLRDLGSLGGDYTAAMAINERGQVVGESNDHAFLWQNGKMRDLGTGRHAFDINERAEIVGFGLRGAFLWRKGVMTDLGALGGSDAAIASKAYSINELGQVVGEAATRATWMDKGIRRAVRHAFLWQNGKMTDLGSLGGPGSQSLAWGNTDRGEIVGSAETGKRDTDGEAVSRAVLWTYKP